MTPYTIVLGLLESGPKTKQQLIAALGGTRRRAEVVIAQLRERQDVATIGKGLYALRGAA